MEKSESITNLTKALVAFQATLKPVAKTETNPFFKSRYADLSGIWDSIRTSLSSNGLAVSQLMEGENLNTMLMHVSGEWIASSYPINAKAPEPQAVGSAVTYARRYALSAILGIVADDDDDGEIASGRNQQKPIEKPQEAKVAAAADEVIPIDPEWLKESLGVIQWPSFEVGKYLREKYSITGKTIMDIVKKMTPMQAGEFAAEIERRLKEVGKG